MFTELFTRTPIIVEHRVARRGNEGYIRRDSFPEICFSLNERKNKMLMIDGNIEIHELIRMLYMIAV